MPTHVATARSQAELQRSSRLAWCCAWVPLGVTGVLALIIGSKLQTDGAPAREVQRLKALALLQCCWVGWCLALALVWWLPSQNRMAQRVHIDRCCNNLRRVAEACNQFRDGPGMGQRFPVSLQELRDSGLIGNAELHCPLDHRANVSYSYSGDTPMFVHASGFLLAYETYSRHGNDPAGYLAVFADARVEWLTFERLQTLIREQRGADR